MEDFHVGRGTNYISKQQMYAKKKFPENSRERLVVKASQSGVGFESKFVPSLMAEIIKESVFSEEVKAVQVSNEYRSTGYASRRTTRRRRTNRGFLATRSISSARSPWCWCLWRWCLRPSGRFWTSSTTTTI